MAIMEETLFMKFMSFFFKLGLFIKKENTKHGFYRMSDLE